MSDGVCTVSYNGSVAYCAELLKWSLCQGVKYLLNSPNTGYKDLCFNPHRYTTSSAVAVNMQCQAFTVCGRRPLYVLVQLLFRNVVLTSATCTLRRRADFQHEATKIFVARLQPASAALAVVRCLSVCPSVRHVRVLYRNE